MPFETCCNADSKKGFCSLADGVCPGGGGGGGHHMRVNALARMEMASGSAARPSHAPRW